MLTQLKFKNWRSLKDETIDFTTPITVFIGANSSGKTNILDALYFLRYVLNKGVLQTVMDSGFMKIQTDALQNEGDVELRFTYALHPEVSKLPVTEALILKFDKRDVPFQFARRLYEADILIDEVPFREFPLRNVVEVKELTQSLEEFEQEKRTHLILHHLYSLTQKRWQILSEHFKPIHRISLGGDPYVIESDAQNTLLILDLMRQGFPEIYGELQEVLNWLLGHITGLYIREHRENRDLELIIQENEGKGAPTISAGTGRIIAMLTAYYALDIPQEYSSNGAVQVLPPSFPGLVVIEEPDTALNPWVVKKFVDQLRDYVDREHPRQFILTTHNPHMLDFFEPEEIRVVSRDENGYTTVNRIPDYIKDIWLKDGEYSLGEVWLTNSFGGVPG